MHAQPMVGIDLLGRLRLTVSGAEVPAGPPRQRALLGYLAANPGETVARDDLVTAMWGERPPVSAARNVQAYVAGLRRLIDHGRPAGSGAEVLVTAGFGYRLDLPRHQVDAVRARELADEAAAHARTGDWAGAIAPWRSALALWRGVPYADIEAPYVAAERSGLANLRVSCVQGLAEALLATGRAADAVTVLASAVDEHLLHERLTELSMQALHAVGRTADAITLYVKAADAMADRLGLDLAPGLRALYDKLLADRGAPRPGTLPPLPPRSPFTGRHTELDDLATRLDAHLASPAGGRPLILVLDGPPGIGKTALAVEFAHRVRDRFPDGSHFIDFRGHRPGEDPLSTAEVLRRLLGDADPGEQARLYRSRMAGRRVLLVLDDVTAAEQVRPLLPGSSACVVVVTSRIRLGLVARDGAIRVPVHSLTDADAVEMLTTLLRRDDPAAAELAGLCGNLPLALRIAATAAGQRPLTGLVEWLRPSQTRVSRLSAGGEDLASAFATSLSGLSPLARDMFVHTGLYIDRGVSQSVGSALLGVPVEVAKRLLDEITTAGLYDWGPRKLFRTHPLIRMYAGELAAAGLTEDQRTAAEDRQFRRILHTTRVAHHTLFPLRAMPGEAEAGALEMTGPGGEVPPIPPFPDELNAAAWFWRSREHQLAMVDLAEHRGRDDVVAWLSLALADLRGLTEDAEPLLRKGLAAAQRSGNRRASTLTKLRLGDLTADPAWTDEAELPYVLGLAQPIGSVEAIALFAVSLRGYAARGDRAGQAIALMAIASAWLACGTPAPAKAALRAAVGICTVGSDSVADPHGRANPGIDQDADSASARW